MIDFLGVISFCYKKNEISTFSPSIFYHFSAFRLWGLLCLSPSRFVRFLVVLASNSGAPGLPFVPLASDFCSFWVPLWSLWLPFGFLLVPFGSLLAPFGSLWLPLAPLGFLLVPFGSLLVPLGFALVPFWLTCGSVLLPWGPLCRPSAPRLLPEAETCRKQPVEYILNTSTMFVSNKDSILFMNSKNDTA